MDHRTAKDDADMAWLLKKNDKRHRSNLRDLGYSDKIVEKLSPYQAYWLHRYHIYNHADEIFHAPEQPQEFQTAAAVPPRVPPKRSDTK